MTDKVKTPYPHVALLGAPAGKNAVVHMLNPETRVTICHSGINQFEMIDGVRVQRLWVVDKPLTCKSCAAALETICRNRLTMLNPVQLEQFLVDTNGQVFPE